MKFKIYLNQFYRKNNLLKAFSKNIMINKLTHYYITCITSKYQIIPYYICFDDQRENNVCSICTKLYK